MITRLTLLLRGETGSAAVEMALVTPLLLTLMFGSFELGNYFLDEHVVTKAVRDGARYAARLPVTEYYSGNSCSAGPYSGTKLSAIQNVTRTGRSDNTGTPRLITWTDASTISVSVACKPVATYPGIYTGLPGDVPVVTVIASVPYNTVFSRLGWQIGRKTASSTTLNLNAQSQAAVIGI